MGSGRYLKAAIKKYGIENFKREILEFHNSKDELYSREKELVNRELIKDPMCMNIMEGGRGGFISDEQQKSRSRAAAAGLRDKRNSDPAYDILWRTTHKAARKRGKDHPWFGKQCYSWLDKEHSESTKRKIGEMSSLAQKGELNSQYGTCWIYNLHLKENKKIKSEQLEEYLKLGWIKGRKLNWSISLK